MAIPPQGGQYSPYSPYPQAPVAPAQPARPAAMQRAVTLIYVGAALAIVGGIVSGLTTHNLTIYTYGSPNANTGTVHTMSFVVAGIIGGIIQAGLWLWMAWKTGAGRNWARVLSSVFFGFMCLSLIGATATLSSGEVFAFIVALAEWGVGLAALIHLWQRESGEFCTLAKQAASYGGAYGGYQPYGQQPYGQPGYGQPDHGQPPYGQAPPPPPNS